ncbi:DUF5134 domain-containing protein [Rugosimonospora africana]|uniref:DUF5134 domain-containing protein n=1 Tax=Rugosimonospora africana TaxID=556532 RepID=A0A8J3VRC0_9ACTN|nr:DUF5134 domain-containing protein [Rugosimonospora africana]GIH15942.1 hypothetical protein Raf01_41140 [Rugosimonospora africana]
MAASLELRWPLALAFAALGGYCLVRCVWPAARSGHAVCDRVSDAAHAAMSVAMVAMLWAPRPGDRWGLQPAAFAVLAGWFLVRATGRAHSRRHRIGLVHQGVVMAAMCWMLLAASPVGSSVSGVLGGGSATMPMPGAVGHATGAVTTGAVTSGAVTTGVLAGYLALAALWWLRAATVAGSPARASTADGRVLSGPALSGPVVSGPVVSEPVVSGPVASGSALFGPAVSGPALSGAALFGAALFGPVGENTCQALMATAMVVALLASL